MADLSGMDGTRNLYVSDAIHKAFLEVRDQGADYENNQTIKQLNYFIWTNRKQVTLCFYLPIGPNKIV